MIRSRIKLLHVTSSLKVGGAEAVLCDLIEGLGSDYFEHHVIYFHDGPRAERLRKAGVSLYQVKGLVGLYDPIFFFRLFRLIKKLKPDLIHSLLWSANVSSRLVAKLLAVPHISVYHNNIDQDGTVRNILDGLTRRFSDRLVAVSHEVAQSIMVMEKKVLPVQVIVNGIDADGARAKGQEQKIEKSDLGFSDDTFVIGSVGRFCPVKNYSFLIDVVASLSLVYPHIRLVLVGLGPDEQSLRNQAKDLGVAHKVIFVVEKSSYGYYSVFDCFVQSSLKEGISIALLEAMSCGVPCIVSSPTKEHPVITSGDDGILVPSGDKKKLKTAIARFVEDNELCVSLGIEGRKTVMKKFDLVSMLDAYRNLFFSISKRK